MLIFGLSSFNIIAMLRFKIIPHILAKGNFKPFSYLCKVVGFSKGKAANFTTDSQKSISLTDLSQLCVSLNCTPNDLFYWQQTPNYTLPEGHILLTSLSQPLQYMHWQKALKQLPGDEVEEIYELIQEKIKNRQLNK